MANDCITRPSGKEMSAKLANGQKVVVRNQLSTLRLFLLLLQSFRELTAF